VRVYLTNLLQSVDSLTPPYFNPFWQPFHLCLSSFQMINFRICIVKNIVLLQLKPYVSEENSSILTFQINRTVNASNERYFDQRKNGHYILCAN
jgi:hypothetical protein